MKHFLEGFLKQASIVIGGDQPPGAPPAGGGGKPPRRPMVQAAPKPVGNVLDYSPKGKMMQEAVQKRKFFDAADRAAAVAKSTGQGYSRAAQAAMRPMAPRYSWTSALKLPIKK